MEVGGRRLLDPRSAGPFLVTAPGQASEPLLLENLGDGRGAQAPPLVLKGGFIRVLLVIAVIVLLYDLFAGGRRAL